MTLVLPRYPVYVISKGRSSRQGDRSARFLIHDQVPFSLVVEPQEEEEYREAWPEANIHVLPFSNLGQGSIPARNWVWEHAKDAGYDRHWILDDNIRGMWRRWKARKIRCQSGVAYAAMEDFVDRYENVAVAGPNYYMFSVNKQRQPPFIPNVHVYSCLLIDNALPFRWRGRYNEDTDLCLQALAAGLCTIQFNAFLSWKMTTMTMAGGNSAELYQGDGRLRMARELERVWPYVVTTDRRYGRPQHVVRDSWRKFDTPLRLKPGVDLDALPRVNNYGMELVERKEGRPLPPGIAEKLGIEYVRPAAAAAVEDPSE